jgi:hypothetical protein
MYPETTKLSQQLQYLHGHLPMEVSKRTLDSDSTTAIWPVLGAKLREIDYASFRIELKGTLSNRNIIIESFYAIINELIIEECDLIAESVLNAIEDEELTYDEYMSYSLSRKIILSMYVLTEDIRDIINSAFPLTSELPKVNFKNSLLSKHHDALISLILPDYIEIFERIEKGLLARGYLDESYQWVKFKKKLVDFIVIIQEFRYFKPHRNGKKLKPLHHRQNIAELYGFDKTGLTDINQKYKPTLLQAEASFLWIKNLIDSNYHN